MANYYKLSSLSLFCLAESGQRIFEISARDVITEDYTIIMSRTLKVTDNHVMYGCGAWWSKGNHVKFARFVLLVVSEGANTWLYFFSVQCIIKQLLDSVFVIFRIIEASVRVISLSLRLRLITLTSTSIILDITKTSSNNCLLSTQFIKPNYRIKSTPNCFVSFSLFLICS